MFRISDEGIALIKSFEGLELEAYRDAVGILTIGYGHTGNDVFEGQVISEAEAEDLLRRDLDRFERAVNEAVKAPITQSMFDALVSLAFNIGSSAVKRSTAVKRTNSRDYLGAAEAITWWNKAGGQVLAGLVRRRAAESALYLRDADEVSDVGASAGTSAEGQVQENSPRRSNPVTTRTTAGATTAGAAGAAGAGAVLMDDDEEATGTEVQMDEVEDVIDEANDMDADDEPTSDPDEVMDDIEDMDGGDADEDSADDEPTGDETGDETGGDETGDPTEGTTTETREEMQMPEEIVGRDATDAIVVGAGVLGVLAAIYVISARIDDWRKYKR